MTRKRRTKNFGDVIRAELAADGELALAVEEEAIHADIARAVYRLRTEAGLTQTELAREIGSHQTVISRVEDADYDGHSLAIIIKIAFALNKRVDVSFHNRPSPTREVTEVFAVDWSAMEAWPTQVGEADAEIKAEIAKDVNDQLRMVPPVGSGRAMVLGGN